MVPDAIPALKPQQPGKDAGKDILAEQPAYDLIELFFFAYRDFVSDPDRILDEYGFGRAHHRVLHFVSRQPGLTIAELLDILRITKQSLNRVLKELIEKDFIESRMGTSDRRQRLLFATAKGHDLALKLAKLQTRRIMRALSEMDPEAKDTVSRYLLRLIDPDDSAHVKQLVFGLKKT
ncbi:MarR family transcriptional regulator [Microvirga sp. 3-52]|jgi:DNA-binding MarR family transcriptional regulator|uniref:MarR family winged helix-turn-helix transcriptional regulator n=1 Tax=Microvirga sp. 3-52 TaxID=2792425 RepID=UPI001ACA49A4|nr:MarR family transcriptional regulator [Microvirga sp. 3-52]MBO1903674.1 MarR family transcriptional regulator [Microvirga sp. 3-52]MBS7450737.1 MarR family transcriptional regulator [Microvirga sp. 3-52]